ncbi:MAG: hypothetical protein KA779_06800, partial [Propionivibrio sp.]|nr:hypothetical protein [Propionivibrio sp.]
AGLSSIATLLTPIDDRAKGNRMNAVRINPSPFKGEVGRGMGFFGGYFVDQSAVRAPSPPHPSP